VRIVKNLLTSKSYELLLGVFIHQLVMTLSRAQIALRQRLENRIRDDISGKA